MKIVSADKAFIYYVVDTPDGKSEGIRLGRSTGAAGFTSEKPAAEQTHPIRFVAYDNPAVRLPAKDLPPILKNVLGSIQDEHPEIHDILSGKISFENALKS